MRVLFITHSFPRYTGDVAGSFILRLASALTDTTTAITRTTQALTASATETLAAQLRASQDRTGTFDPDKVRAAFRDYEDALARIADLERQRTAALEEQARALQAFRGNNEVLKLRLGGNNSAADAAQVQLDIMAKVDAATKQFGSTVEVAEYALLLFAQAAQDAADAERRKVQESQRAAFDLTNDARAPSPIPAARAKRRLTRRRHDATRTRRPEVRTP